MARQNQLESAKNSEPTRADLFQALRIIEDSPDPELDRLREEATEAREKFDDFCESNQKYRDLKATYDKATKDLSDYEYGDTKLRNRFSRDRTAKLDKIRQRLYAEGVTDKTRKLVLDAVEEFQAQKD